ncbi:MAG: DUF2061 domain-containing protein [Planctomycetota bacterium]
MESRKRSILKALSWRLAAFVITATVVQLMTGRLELAAGVGLADTLVKLGVFYWHERLWNRIEFGRTHGPDYEI